MRWLIWWMWCTSDERHKYHDESRVVIHIILNMWLKYVHHEVSPSGNKHTPFIINHLSGLLSIYHVSFYDTCMNIYYLSCIHLRCITRSKRHSSTLSSSLFLPLLTSDTLTNSITLGLSLTPLSTLGISDWSDDYTCYIIYIPRVCFQHQPNPIECLEVSTIPNA